MNPLWLSGVFVALIGAPAQKESPAFTDDPKAHAVYDGMVQAIRKAKALSWTADYSYGFLEEKQTHAKYKIWLQKPNFARMDAFNDGQDSPVGRMILDGAEMWSFWPGGKPPYQWDSIGKRAEEYKLYGRKFYKHRAAPVGRHSIGHIAPDLGPIACLTVLDPSTFHGYTDSLQPYIDGVQFVPGKTIDGEDCLGIEVSFMKHQRSWVIWLSKKDRIPRRLEQTIRVKSDLLVTEAWSDVKVNELQDPKMFAWKPPKGWKEYRDPKIEEGLLTPGTVAPDFELAGLNGGKVKLSDYRGKVVWVNKWRCG